MMLNGTFDVMKSTFYIVVHHRRRCVVMDIRGINTIHNVFIDLNPHNKLFEGG